MVNIIIPLYHSLNTIEKTLDSLVAQTKPYFLVTLVQDCDGEDYSEIIKEYSRRGLNISLLKTPVNCGPGLARQMGINNCTKTEYLMFLDSDDLLMPRAIEVLSREIKSSNNDIVISSFIAARQDSTATYMDSDTSPVTWVIGKIYKRSYLIDNKIEFLPQLRLNEDSYFNLVAVNCTDKKSKIREYLGVASYNKNSLTRKDGRMQFFKASADQYIESQILGILKIIEIRKDISITLLAHTLCNIYRHIERARYFGVDVSNSCIKLSLLNTPEINKFTEIEDFWKTIQSTLSASEIFDNNLIFYEVPFDTWLQNILYGGTN